jgi:DNA-binding XRE family transcriptional regulator
MGLTLKQYRINAGLSQTRLAREAELSRDAVRNAESGDPIRAETARAIVDVLNKRLDEKVLVSDIEGLKVL